MARSQPARAPAAVSGPAALLDFIVQNTPIAGEDRQTLRCHHLSSRFGSWWRKRGSAPMRLFV